MLKKIFGGGDKPTGPRPHTLVSTDGVDQDDTIVIDLSPQDAPAPEDIRLVLEEEDQAAAKRHPAAAERPPATAQPAAPPAAPVMQDGDETVVWVGDIPPAPQLSAAPEPAQTATARRLVVGWLAVTEGAQRGASFPVGIGRNLIGRDATNTIVIDFGDHSISKQNHATIAADPKTRGFFLIPGDSTNFAYLNEEPLLEAKKIEDGATIQIGATQFVFIQFAGKYADWS